MKKLTQFILESTNPFKNQNATHVVINEFALTNYDIVLNGQDTKLGYVMFKVGDEINFSSQSGSLGDISTVTNLRSNKSAKFWSMSYGLPTEMAGNVKSADEIKNERREIKYSREQWYLQLLNYADKAGKDDLELRIYASDSIGISGNFRWGVKSTKILQTKDIKTNAANMCLVEVLSKEFQTSSIAKEYATSTVQPAVDSANLASYVKVEIIGSRISLKLNPYSDLSDISCFPKNWKGKVVKKNFLTVIKEVFYVDIEKFKAVKKPKTTEVKLPKVKTLNSKDFSNALLKNADKIGSKTKLNVIHIGKVLPGFINEALNRLQSTLNPEVSIRQISSDDEKAERGTPLMHSTFKTTIKGSATSFEDEPMIKFICRWNSTSNMKYELTDRTSFDLTIAAKHSKFKIFLSEEQVAFVKAYVMDLIIKDKSFFVESF